MSDAKDQTIALIVRLKPSESSAHPRATNYTNTGVVQGIAYLDFGFIEPALLAAIAKTAKDGQAGPKGLDGAFVTRVAMGVDVLARLHQQIQRVGRHVGGAAGEAESVNLRSGANETCTITRPPHVVFPFREWSDHAKHYTSAGGRLCSRAVWANPCGQRRDTWRAVSEGDPARS